MLIYLSLFKFLKQIQFKLFFNTLHLTKINNKKNLFFKKKFNTKVLVSKRLSFVLRKRKKLKNFKSKKVDKGNFFFKKFFFKILLKSRKSLRRFFFFNSKVRQQKITKHIFKNQKLDLINSSYEFTLFNLLLRSHFCIFMGDVISLIKNNFVYLNGLVVSQVDLIVLQHDCIQLKITTTIYKYIQFCKKNLKKKLSLFRFNSWKFFKQKFLKQQQQLKTQKRKTPKYLYLFFLFRLDVPKYLEVDYCTLSIYFLGKLTNCLFRTYYFNKFFSYKLFALYNFKKIN